MSARTKAELARRLGMSEADLIGRKEAAAILGLDEDTLRTKADQHVGFFKLSASQTARAIYPRPWVLKYRDWRASGRRQGSFPSGMAGPERDWPPEPDAQPLGRKVTFLMIERWKYRELHARCEAICAKDAPVEQLWERHRSEHRILFDNDHNRRSMDEPEVFQALVEKAKEIAQPEGIFVNPEHLASLVKVVWEHILEKEREWLVTATL
jgi:hypothetical protein